MVCVHNAWVAKRLCFAAIIANCLKIDRPVAAASNMVDRGRGLATNCTNSTRFLEQIFSGSLGNDVLPERATTAHEIPKDLADTLLALRLEYRSFFHCAAELSNEGGNVSAIGAAIG
jgi:hypothetical protein